MENTNKTAQKYSKYAVLDCEDAKKWEGHAELYWLAKMRRSGEDWTVFKVYNGEFPNLANDEWKGIIITGSRHSVYDPSLKSWLDPFFQFIRDFAEYAKTHPESKMYGTCFGCQAIGLALGGSAGKNPSGRFVFKNESIQLSEEFKQIWSDRPDSIGLLESHGDCVLELPPSAKLLGSSASTKNEIFSIGNNILAVQAHPELDVPSVSEKIYPFLVENKRLNDEEAKEAVDSFNRPLSSDTFLDYIERFLKY